MEWLEQVLAVGTLRGFRVEPVGHPGFSSLVRRVHLDIRDPRQTLSVIAKFGHPKQGVGVYRSFYRAETQVYEGGLGSLAGIPKPRCYFAHCDGREKKFVLLLEDYPAAVGGNLLVPLTPPQVSAVVRSLARLHALHWEPGAVEPFHPERMDWMEETGKIVRLDGEVEPYLVNALEGLREQSAIGDSLYARLAGQKGALSFAVDRHREEFTKGHATTVIHGDVHPGNLLWRRLDDPNSAVWLDWQCVTRAKAAYDLALLLGCNTPTEVRRRGESGWLAEYTDALAENRIDYPRDLLAADYRLALLFSGLRWLGVALAMSSRALEGGESHAWARLTTDRIGCTFEDWGILS